MSNIIEITTRRPFRSDRNAVNSNAVLELARERGRQALFAALPARITRNPTLNRALTDLQRCGWQVSIGGKWATDVVLAHPSNPGRWLSLGAALKRQRQLAQVQ